MVSMVLLLKILIDKVFAPFPRPTSKKRTTLGDNNKISPPSSLQYFVHN